MATGEITIKLEGASFEETERCREIIRLLFVHGAFSVRGGKVIMHFDPLGLLDAIQLDITKWRRKGYPQVNAEKVLYNIDLKSQKPISADISSK